MIGKLVYSDGWFVEYEVVTTKGRVIKELPVHPNDISEEFNDEERVSFDVDFEIALDKIKRYAKLKK